MEKSRLSTICCAVAVSLLASASVHAIYFTECKGLADIVVAFPASDIVRPEHLKLFEEFFIGFVEYFPLNIIDGTRISFIQYGKNATVVSALEPFKTQIELKTRVSLMARREINSEVYMAGYDPASAIEVIHAELNKSGRVGARQLGVLFTVGVTPDPYINNVITQADSAMGNNITLFAVNLLATSTDFARSTDESCKRFHITDWSGLMVTLPHITTSLCNYLQDMPPFPMLCLNPALPLLMPQPPAPFTCPAATGRFADPLNCAYYYDCVGLFTYRYQCDVGLLFDPVANKCTQKEFSPCFAEYNCPLGFRGLLPYIGDCSKFVNCWDGKAVVQQCAHGLYFDKDIQACNHAANVLCTFGDKKIIPLI